MDHSLTKTNIVHAPKNLKTLVALKQICHVLVLRRPWLESDFVYKKYI